MESCLCFCMNKYKQSFSFRRQIKSFNYAFCGLRILLKEEHNIRIHLAAGILILITSFVFDINRLEWIFIVFSIGLVIVAETINTAIENICNFISPQKDNRIKKIKDISATAVLLASIVAVTVGIIIFLPKL